MSEQQKNLPVRVAEVVDVADQVVRFLRSRQIVEAEQAERELTTQAARAARRGMEPADNDARAALRKALRLRADLVAWKAELPEVEEVVRQSQDLNSMVAESRVDLDRFVQSLERTYRAAEAKAAMTRLANWMREIDRRVRVDLAGRVRDIHAEADAQYTTALDHEETRILRLRSENVACEVDDELERLRRNQH